MQADQGAGRSIHRVGIERPADAGGVEPARRIEAGHVVGETVPVPAPHGREPRIESVRRERRAVHRDVGVRAQHPAHARGDGSCPRSVAARP